MQLFEECLRHGVYHHSTWDTFGRTPMFGLRHYLDASVDDFVVALSMFIQHGAEIDHIDAFGDTLLLMTENDNLGVALVRVGATTRYDWKDYTKMGLTNAAVYGLTRTIDAIAQARKISRQEFDSSLDNAAKILAYNGGRQDMAGIVKLIVNYGADPNTNNTLHYSVKTNHVLVQTLVSLGASVDSLAWDYARGVDNTPLHRVMDISTFEVFQALVSTGVDVNLRDGAGATPMMAIMKTLLYSHEATLTRINWLLERGASFLPFDKRGNRVSDMIRGKYSPFKELVAERVREENWCKRRGIILLRHYRRRLIPGRVDATTTSSLIEGVAGLHVEGVFRNIVAYW